MLNDGTNDPNVWDAITIGSGLGALTAGASLARQGWRVLVLERLSNFGGAATVYRHGALTMEASLHETDGATVFAPHGVFARLGLQDRLRPVPTEIFYEVRGGPLTSAVRVPHGLAAAEAALAEARPEAAKALSEHFHDLGRLYRSIDDLQDMAVRGPSALLGTLFSGRLFELIAQARRTVSNQYDGTFGEDEISKLILAAVLAYFDDDPAELSHLMYSGVWTRYLEDGSYYFDGGSRALTMALLKLIRESGGEARRNVTATGIPLDEAGQAEGVRFRDADGNEHFAKSRIVLGGAAPEVLAAMLPDQQAQALRKAYSEHTPSISLFNVSLGLREPAETFGVAAYSTFILPNDLTRLSDYPAACARFGASPAEAMPPYAVADYGRLDAGIRRDGDLYLVSLCGVDRLAWWEDLSEEEEMARRAEWTAALIADVDRHYPGLAGAVSHSEIATARTMMNRLGTPEGSVYGFRPTPSRVFGGRPRAATTVPGLFLASAYTVSGGYSGAMHGGLMAADEAVRARRAAVG
jgi:all-trans-retinol 13,14-reductase